MCYLPLWIHDVEAAALVPRVAWPLSGACPPSRVDPALVCYHVRALHGNASQLVALLAAMGTLNAARRHSLHDVKVCALALSAPPCPLNVHRRPLCSLWPPPLTLPLCIARDLDPAARRHSLHDVTIRHTRGWPGTPRYSSP
jgi:hypothetical protein